MICTPNKFTFAAGKFILIIGCARCNPPAGIKTKPPQKKPQNPNPIVYVPYCCFGRWTTGQKLNLSAVVMFHHKEQYLESDLNKNQMFIQSGCFVFKAFFFVYAHNFISMSSWPWILTLICSFQIGAYFGYAVAVEDLNGDQ